MSVYLIILVSFFIGYFVHEVMYKTRERIMDKTHDELVEMKKEAQRQIDRLLELRKEVE